MSHDEAHADASRAFVRAHEVLVKCEVMGLTAYVEMFVDGSGTLVLTKQPTNEQAKELSNMIRSNRWDRIGQEWRLTSCCGWKP